MLLYVAKRQKQDEGPTSRDDRGFVLVVCFLAFLRVTGPLALPSARHEVSSIGISVRYHSLPRLEVVSNNMTTRLSAPAETRGCYQLAGWAAKVELLFLSR